MFADAAGFTKDMADLIGTSVTDQQFLSIVEHLNPKPTIKTADGEITNEASITKWENRRDDLWKMWTDDPRVGYRNTAWGAYQTFSTYAQNERSYRDMKGTSRAARNIGSLLSGQTDRADLKVLSTVRQLVAV